MANQTTSDDHSFNMSKSHETRAIKRSVSMRSTISSRQLPSSGEAKTIRPSIPTGFKDEVSFAGVVFGAASFVFAMIYVGCEPPNFVGEHMGYFKGTLILCCLGVLIYLVYLCNYIDGYSGDLERRYNTFLRHASIYLIYYGMAFWVVVMFTASFSIMILSWVVLAVAPFIIFSKYIYQGNWWRVSEMCRVLVTNLDPDVTVVMIMDYFKKNGGAIHGIQMQPEKSSALITYQNFAEGDLAIRVCNSNNELLGTTKPKCSWAGPEAVC